MEKINEAYLELLRRCVLNCKHCYISEKEKTTEMPREDWFKIIDKLTKFKIKRCVLLGGEPTIKKDFYDILAYAISNFREVVVETAGVTKSYFADYDCAVAVSFESCYKEKNDEIRRFPNSDKSVYEIAVKKLLDGRKYDNPKICRFTLYNDTDVLGSIIFAEKLGANAVFMPLINLGNATNLVHRIPSAKKIKEAVEICINANLRMKGYHQVQIPQWFLINIPLLKKYGSLFKKQKGICAAGKQRIFINYVGDVFPCMFLPQFKLGNILKESILKINKRIREFNKKIAEIEPHGKCRGCDAWDYCHGGCIASYIKDKSKMGSNCPLAINLNKIEYLKGGK